MKKLLTLMMALVIVFSFAACGKNDEKNVDKKETTVVEQTEEKKNN